MSDDVMTFGFDRKDIVGAQRDKYLCKKGTTDRIGIIFNTPETCVSCAKTHYDPATKRRFICKKSVCCDKFGEPENRWGCAVIKYDTDTKGNLKTPLDYTILPWIFADAKYTKIQVAGSEWSVFEYDIKVTCGNGGEDEKFQKIELTMCRESVWLKKEEFKKKILDEAKPVWSWIKKNLAQNLSIEEIKDLIGGGVAEASDPTTTVDLDSVLSAM